MDQRGRLHRREAQLTHPDLDHVADGAQPREWQPRVGPGDEHQLDSRRQMEQQGRHLLMAPGFPDHVIVVQHQDNRGPEPGQPGDQARDHVVGDVRGLGPQRPQDVLAVQLRAGPLQRGHDMPPEPARVVVPAVERDPREPPVLGRAGPPLGHQGGLAEARGRVDQDQPRRNRTGQLLHQRGPRHPFLALAGGVQLGFDGHIQAGTRPRRPPDGAQRTLWGPVTLGTPTSGH